MHRLCPGEFYALAEQSPVAEPVRRTLEWIVTPIRSGPLEPSIEAWASQMGRDATRVAAPPSTSDGSSR